MDALEIELLPESWQLLFVQQLPGHLKLRLRQCNSNMLRLVDSHPSHRLHWFVPSSAAGTSYEQALQLCSENIACMDISNIQEDEQKGLEHALAATCVYGIGRGVPLPALKELTGRQDQLQLLSALAAAVPAVSAAVPALAAVVPHGSLQKLTLWCSMPCKRGQAGLALFEDSPPLQWMTFDGLLLTKWLEAYAAHFLVASLTHLQLRGRHFHITTSAGPAHITPFVQRLTNLQSLKMKDLEDTDSAEFVAELTSCLQPLWQLTQLHIDCTRGSLDLSGTTGLDLHGLTALQDLTLASSESYTLPMSCLTWIQACSMLTRLHLTGDLSDLDLQIAKELPRLQELTLFGGRTFVSERLQPLADCSSLTRLALDSVIVYVPAPPESAESRHAAASEAGSAGCVTRGRATQTPPPAAAGSSWCLPWIQSLSIGNLGVAEFRAPVATLAPHLTELHNTLWDVLGGSVRLVDLDRGIDGLAGLEKLQVLDVDIYNLDRHAGHLCSLTGLSTLRELRIEPFGERLLESVNLRHGLPQLPHLTKLLIYTKEDAFSENWAESYDTREDLMLWQHQRQLLNLSVMGSTLIGGFLRHADISQQLPQLLPMLQCIGLENCPDLTALQLAELVGVRPAPLIRVQGCQPVTDRDCCVMSLCTAGAVCVEYS